MTDAPYQRELERGEVLDEAYRVVRLIAQGGMGHVYEAEQIRLERRVALKILSVDPKRSGEFLPRFRREAEICAKLAHPHIIAVLDWNVAHGMPYLVMEYLEGEDLGMRITHSALDLAEGMHVLEGIAAGLVAAHTHGVVHRDLKPSNVFLCNVGGTRPHVKLLDFGVSKVTWETTLSTTSPKVLGSPRYMAPEQARGEPNIDARVDQFALGVVAYELFSGHHAFDGESLTSVLYRVVHEQPARLEQRAPHLPEHVIRSIARAMEKEPAKRFEDVGQFVQALRGEVSPDVAQRTAGSTALAPVAGAPRDTTEAVPRPALRPPAPTSEIAPRPPPRSSAMPIAVAVSAIAVAAAAIAWRTTSAPTASPSAPSVPPSRQAPIAGTSGETPTTPPPSRPSGENTTATAEHDKHVKHGTTGATPRDPETPRDDATKRDVVAATDTPSAGGATNTPASTNPQVAMLLKAAQAAYDHGDYSEAIARGRQALGYEDVARAHLLIALAYCELSSLGDARAELFSVRDADKPQVTKTCAAHGIDL